MATIRPLLAAISNHLATVEIALAIAFFGGVYGHVLKSKLLVATAILVIAVISIYFVVAGEGQTGSGILHGH